MTTRVGEKAITHSRQQLDSRIFTSTLFFLFPFSYPYLFSLYFLLIQRRRWHLWLCSISKCI